MNELIFDTGVQECEHCGAETSMVSRGVPHCGCDDGFEFDSLGELIDNLCVDAQTKVRLSWDDI